MNILLVRVRPDRQTINLQSFMICEPLELEYLYAALEAEGHSVEIADLLVDRKPLKHFIKKVKPEIIAFTAYLPHVRIVKEYCKAIKEYDSKIYTVVGGVHSEVVPLDFKDKHIDFIVRCNGIKTFTELVKNISSGGPDPASSIPGIYEDQKQEYKLDWHFSYPFPDRESTKRYRNRYNYIFHDKCATLKTSFGCPYKCEFCFCIQVTGHHYMERDINEVVEEIKTIKEDNIFIVDDNFLYNKKRIHEFCALLDKQAIKKKFIAFGRSDFIVNNRETISLLHDHGLTAIFVGIESFKEQELSDLNKRTSVELNVEAVRIIEGLGMDCYSGIIVGYDWAKEDFDNLISFLNSFERPLVNIQPITPMPGTPLFEKTKDQIDIKRERYELWDMAHLIMKPSKLDISQFYKHILRTYFKTTVTLKINLWILKKYGLKVYLRTINGAFHIAFQYIRLMLTSKKRKGNN